MVAANAAIIFVLAFAMWRIAVRINDPSFIERVGAPASSSWRGCRSCLTDGRRRAAPARRHTTSWGLRLGGLPLLAWRKKRSRCARYVAMLKHAPNPKMFMLTKVFLLQAVLLSSSPAVELGQRSASRRGLGPVQACRDPGLADHRRRLRVDRRLPAHAFKADRANEARSWTKDCGDSLFTRTTRATSVCGGAVLPREPTPTRSHVIGVVGPLVMSVFSMR